MKPLALLSALLLATSAIAAKKPSVGLQPNPKKLNPPPGVVVPAAVKAELAAGAAALGKEIEALRVSLKSKPELLALLPDVQIYHNAVRYALEDDIFTSTNQFNSARALLKQGLARAAALKSGSAPWNTKPGLLEVKRQMEADAAAAAAKKKQPAPAPLTHVPVARGYVSRIDGSVQPYGLHVPASYLLTRDDLPRRLDFWLHGRGDTLNEIAFIEGQQKGNSAFQPNDTFVLHPYGRFMNAFKFAGETDVFEGLDDAAKHYPIDRNKLAMRGFSMGGAGTWHLGAHHADKFAAVNPGAGFVDVKNYQKLGDKLGEIPWYEQKLWNLYDPLACPINLVNTTLVAYSGEIDAQKAAADLMETALAKDGVKMTHIIGPKTGHAYEPEAKKVVAKLVDQAVLKGPYHDAKKVSLVMHSLKWNQAHWLKVLALESHWDAARIDAEFHGPSLSQGSSLSIKTKGVMEFVIEVPIVKLSTGVHWPLEVVSVTVDGVETKKAFQKIDDKTASCKFVKQANNWKRQGPASTLNRSLAKSHNLQGPIDDAFMDSFVMVRPTGQPLNAAVGKWAGAELKEAVFHWRRYFRGEPRVRDDSAITDANIAGNNLILWGDPSSNKLLARIADKLPIQWSAKEIKVGGKTYDATKNVPAFIFPNPLNPTRYVVINSGFTFPQFTAASNSLQTPKLPDWAILDMSVPLAERVAGKGVVAADFFGEKWEVKTAGK